MESPFKPEILKGKVALLTGGASGIGFEISTQFSKHGASIAVMGRCKTVVDSAVSSLQSLGIPVLTFCLFWLTCDHASLQEWGTDYDIRVNGIAPGPINDTAGVRKLGPDEIKSKTMEMMPLFKLGEKWDIAVAALYLFYSSSIRLHLFSIDRSHFLLRLTVPLDATTGNQTRVPLGEAAWTFGVVDPNSHTAALLEFLFEAATKKCMELAIDRHGCCVLQKCLSHSDDEPRRRLVREITSNALILSQDPYGNYVVQDVFELQVPWATSAILDQLEGNYGDLAMQKYSNQIMQDPYGNYVIQAGILSSKVALREALVKAIKPHVPTLRTSSYAKKIHPNEPYRIILGDVRDKLNHTRERSRQLLANGVFDVPENMTFTTVEQFLEPLELCYKSLCAFGDRPIGDGSLLDNFRQVSTFRLSLISLDICQESDRHTDVIDSITKYLEIGSYRSWSEEQRQEWLLAQLKGKRPLFGHDRPETEEMSDVLDTLRLISELPSDNFGAYIISMATSPSDVLVDDLLQRECQVKSPLRVVPLFEKLADLKAAPTAMARLFSIECYKNRINGKHEVMIGYSDYGKDAAAFKHAIAKDPKNLEMRVMYNEWPFFRVTIDLVEMVFAKGNPGIAASYDKLLVSRELLAFGERLRANYEETKNLLLLAYTLKWIHSPSSDVKVRPHLSKDIMESTKPAAELVKLNPTSDYVPGLEDALILTIKDIVAGMQNTG
ncbi:hypothetical protein M8C21_013734 [Ambrosia artemisiifolia]|uniref:Uncharacterized protein n=1 Tax=Ambrosia artemisiifolia TaxID=4212 RepID=A0AAD5DCX1_AMBAR|nr:hypothetical protein M8C21_013734 [Ambrosia artemisiifolia]